VSKRPTEARAVTSRLRRPVGWLRDRPIWAKLGIIMVVPTIATIVVGLIGLAGHIGTSNNADQARTLSKLSTDVGLLVHDLQDERAAATMLLSAPNGTPSEATVNAYRRLWTPTDEAQRAYAQRRTGLADLPSSFRNLLRRLDNQLSGLPQLRDQVATRKDVSLTHTAFFYRVLIADLIAIRDSSAQLAGETSLSDRMRAVAAVSNMKEYLAQERVVVLRALGENSLPPARQREFMATVTGQEQARQTFETVATPEEHNLFDQRVAGDDLRLAEKYEGEIDSVLSTGKLTDLDFGAEQWDKALAARSNLLRGVEVELDQQMEAQATELRDAVVRQVLIETGLLLGMLLLAVFIAWLVARSMARSLRELRHGALSVAQYGLPQAVARLRDPALATQMSPVQVAAQIAEPLPVRSRDEFGQVTEAFNAVHLEAVRTAAEQASLRSSVGTMFVNLARRSQILVDRLIGHLDRLERGEEDPDRLAELFQLDHLATRMRRNDENLLVLAGADSTRVQREPAALLDVLRAAQSEVEHYTRIEFGVVDRDIEMAAHAVNDMVHLVAELLDNATAFSPPDSAVIVEARRVGDRAVLLVEDRGIGLSPDQLAELNERLAQPPIVDVAVSRMMGLVVVARLANRHGVTVELRRANDRGTIADVSLPPSVLVPRALAGRPARDNSLPPRQGTLRPALGPALALESGPPSGSSRPEPAFRGFDGRPGLDDRSGGYDGDRLVGAGSGPVGGGPGGGPGGNGPAGPRAAMPAWSDLTGISGANGTDVHPRTPPPPGAVPAGPGDPLPQRRPGDRRPTDNEYGGPLVPRQMPATPPANGFGPGTRAGSGFASPAAPTSGAPSAFVPPTAPTSGGPAAPTSGGPGYGSPAAPTSGAPMGAEPLVRREPGASRPPGAIRPPVRESEPPRDGGPREAAPPVWPPVAPTADETPAPAVPVPGELAAALDMTAEIPKVRGDAGPAAPTSGAPGGMPLAAGPPAASASVAPPAGARAVPFADETMELPIFRELESAWFQSRRAQQAPAGVGAPRTSGAPVANGAAMPAASVSAPPAPAWESAADDGWRAAADATTVQTTEATQSGLPKRVPMAQLVPGGVDKGGTATNRRSPEAVRGLLSAYHRGVQRGRSQPKSPDTASVRPEPQSREQTPEPTTAGPQITQAGKEQEA